MNRTEARQKAQEIVAKMSAEEKVSQMIYTSKAIDHLGLKQYNWWNEALHGVARAGLATVFPQSIGLSATFDPELIQKIGEVIGKEGRIKNELARSMGDRGIYKGLTFWSPNINIVRDPRWGRAHETYGEDPFLTSQMGTAFVKGVQGDDPERLLAAACVKHFAVHSGPEEIRHGFNAEVSEKDLNETYLPAFEKIIKDADVAGLMTSYNAVNGTPMSANQELIDKARGWGFDGYVVSDCGAIMDIYERHHFSGSKAEAAAVSASAGCELNCGGTFAYLNEALEQGLLSEEVLNKAVEDLLTIRFRLEMEEDDELESDEIVREWLPQRKEFELLNYQAAVESIVLLKNNGILPLETPRTIAVIGPNADSKNVLKGNYNGTAGVWTTVLEGLQERLPDAAFLYSEGAHLYKDRIEACDRDPNDRLSEAVAFAKAADVTVLAVGLDPSIEGELGDASNEYAAGDKHDLRLPPGQRALVEAVTEASENVIVVLLSGGALDLMEANDKAAAVLQAWYPGSQGGKAIAAVLMGDENPTGRLPETFYHNADVTFDFADYSMEGKTYRFFEGEPLYPFGYGLQYESLSIISVAADASGVTLLNPFDHAVSMPVLVYAHFHDEGVRVPKKQLVFAKRFTLEAKETRRVKIELDPYWLMVVDEDGTRRKAKNPVTFSIGDQ